MSRNQLPRPARPLPLKWEFAPDIPTYDYIADHHIDDPWGLQEAVGNFIHEMEDGLFLTWEAVIAREQGLPLTEKQEAALAGLLNFGDGEEDRVLYINEIPRTAEPWYVILNKIVPYLLIEPFRTFDVPEEVQCEGWRDLTQCLAGQAGDLSLPHGAASPEEVVPIELRHKLWMQDCFDALAGLGQDEELTLENEEQRDRVELFIRSLREHKDTVQFFNLTLDALLERVILPERDRPIFVQMMQEQLGLKSTAERIADYLGGEQTEQEEQRLLSEKERLLQEEQRLVLEKEGLKQETQRLRVEKENTEREVRALKAREESLRRQHASLLDMPPKKKIGRNDPCPCGSGKKFKKCCLKKQDEDLLD